MKLFERLQELRKAKEGGIESDRLYGIEIGVIRSSFLAINHHSDLTILLGILESEVPYISPVKLEHLSVEFLVRCEIDVGERKTVSGRYISICCRSKDEQMERYFLEIMGSVLELLPVAADYIQVTRTIRGVIELFRSMSGACIGQAMGLWAELFLISHSATPKVLIEAWHEDPAERYDFFLGNELIEVKSTANRQRNHHFSLEQAYPAEREGAVVASVFAEKSSGGTSLGDLWNCVRGLAGEDLDLRLKVDRLCMEYLGSSWQIARREAFNISLARRSLRFYWLDDIPKVAEGPIPGVSDVHFRSSLDLIEPIRSGPREFGRLLGGILS